MFGRVARRPCFNQFGMGRLAPGRPDGGGIAKVEFGVEAGNRVRFGQLAGNLLEYDAAEMRHRNPAHGRHRIVQYGIAMAAMLGGESARGIVGRGTLGYAKTALFGLSVLRSGFDRRSAAPQFLP